MVGTVRGAARQDGAFPFVAAGGLGVAVAVSVVVAAAAGVGPPSAPTARPLDVWAVALAAVTAAAVAVGRRHPFTSLAVLDAVVLAWFAVPYPGRIIALVPLLGCYTLAAARGWRWGLAGAALTALTQIVAIRVVLDDVDTVAVVPIAILLAATAASAGTAVGYYRALLVATRAELARETAMRDERARRLVAEERVRIARELHDVVGHSLATISVQAGMGLHVLDRQPRRAREALAAIKHVSDTGLTDVKTVLGVLRTRPVDEHHLSGLDRLPSLLAGVEGAGLRVELDVDRDGPPLPAPVDLAAYRIVQESLTNVVRHGGARTVWLTMTHEPSRLLIRVRDDGSGHRQGEQGTDRACGQGIEGMRERARALAGSLTAGPHPDGGFEVRAELPVPR